MWSKEKAWEWYNSKPWIRGFCYIPSNRLGGIDMWQEYEWDETITTIDKEMKLAKEWGFNAIRLFVNFFVYLDQHDSFMDHFEQVVATCDKYSIKVMVNFGNDCLVQKHNFHWPKYGKVEYELGWHSGTSKSPHVVLNEPGYDITDEPEYQVRYVEMVKEIVGKYSKDDRILLWDIFNEPGNSLRGMKSFNKMKEYFEAARSYDPIQPCAACCWSYGQDDKPNQEIQYKALEMSDVILYHGYMNFEHHNKTVEFLKKTYDRPMFNTEWLHRIWHNNVDELFPYFRKNNIACFNWGWVTGKSQTREPWEWLFNEYDKGHGKDWDFSKWQHDLVRANGRPYDFKEYEIIKSECQKADDSYVKKPKAND